MNGASFLNQLSPGSFVTLFGSRLAQGRLVAPSVPLPTVLSGASYTIFPLNIDTKVYDCATVGSTPGGLSRDCLSAKRILSATYEQPNQLSVGVRDVFVNGVEVLRDGEHTGAKPGRVVRGPGFRR